MIDKEEFKKETLELLEKSYNQGAQDFAESLILAFAHVGMNDAVNLVKAILKE